MRRQLMVRLPLHRTISGEAWEEVLADALKGRAVGTGVPGGGKFTFDVLAGQAGFSAKTLSAKRANLIELAGQNRAFWFVIGRLPVIAHGESLTASQIGNRVVQEFNQRREVSMDQQSVQMPRMGLLLRSADEREHLYWEAHCCALDRQALKWSWTSADRKSVTGRCGCCGQSLYRFFLSGTQLFGAFSAPRQARLIGTPFLKLDELPTEELYRMLYSGQQTPT